MKKNKKTFYVFIFLIIVALALTGCSIFQRTPDITFDIGADDLSPLSSRTASGIDNYPFCEFSKYEVTVYFIYVYMYAYDNDNMMKNISTHVLLNRPPGNGTAVDLVNEKLSDAMDSELIIDNPGGNAIDSIVIGFDKTAVVNGYLYNLEGAGGTFRTAPGGPIADDGNPPEDWTVDVAGEEQTYIEENPLTPNLRYCNLAMPAAADIGTVGHTHITVEDEEILEIRFPIDLGIIKDGDSWTMPLGNTARPALDSSSRYYKYYLKVSGESYYTDMMRLFTDSNNKIVRNQLVGMPFNGYGGFFVFPGLFWMPDDLDFENTANTTLYDSYYSVNSDGTIYFDAEGSLAVDTVIKTERFDLLDAPGDLGEAVFTIGENDISAEYIRIE